MKNYEIDLHGGHNVFVDVYHPEGGRWVCDIKLEYKDLTLHVTDINSDVAETLRDRLTYVLGDMAENDGKVPGEEDDD
jgi:hypothetical protein